MIEYLSDHIFEDSQDEATLDIRQAQEVFCPMTNAKCKGFACAAFFTFLRIPEIHGDGGFEEETYGICTLTNIHKLQSAQPDCD